MRPTTSYATSGLPNNDLGALGGWLRAALLGQMKNRPDRPLLTAPQVLLHHERQVDRVLIDLAVTPLPRQVNTLGPVMLLTLSRQDFLPFPSPRHQYKHT